MDTLLSIKVFRQVVESGSFTAAAAALDMSVAMVSKHVQHLERHLGTRLLTRTSRKVALNDPGTLYYERSSEALNLLEEAENALGRAEETPRGILRVTAPTWFSGRFFARLLTGYRQQCPEVYMDVSLSDKFVDLVEEGLDLALRVSSTDEGRAITPIAFVLVGSAAYFARRGRPRTWKDLIDHEVVSYAYASAGPLAGLPSHWRTNNTSLMGQLAAEGAALTVLPRYLLEDVPGLEVILPDVVLPSPTLYAVTHGRRHMAARVRTFLDYLDTQLIQRTAF